MATFYTKQSCSEPNPHVTSKRKCNVCLIRPSVKALQVSNIFGKVAAVMWYSERKKSFSPLLQCCCGEING